MHPTLLRQIKKFLQQNSPLPEGWEEFSNRISKTYYDYEEDRKLIERSLELSSGELTQTNDELQKKTLELTEKLTDLEKTKKSILNIMEDLQQEKQIAEEEKTKDDILLQSIGDGMIAVDANGKILKINNVVKKMVGLQDEVVIGKDAFEAFSVYGIEDRIVDRERRPEIVSLETGESVTDTFTFIRKDKSKQIINIIANPVIQNEKVIGAIMIYSDVTKEREIDRMKTEFISLASHQLRTPLSAIKWFTEMLLAGDAGKLNDEQQDFAKNISDSTQRMVQLVNSLLNISRIESGRIIVDPQPTDLKELLQGVINDLKAKIEERKQAIIISIHDDLPKINIDARLIRQVYMNLLTNAIKYTPKNGEISVFISKKGEEVVSQISDNGYGIPEQDQSKIFQKFFRAENAVKIETDGTGLGLYLIKAIVDSSGGKLWFKSEKDVGSTFWFTLPLAGMKAREGDVTLDG